MSSNKIKSILDSPGFGEKGEPICAQVDPEIFFPLELEGALTLREKYEDEEGAKKVCSECPYRFACLDFALKDLELQGIWGGTTHLERRRLKRTLRSQKRRQMLQ